MKFSLSPSVTLVPGHNATCAIAGLSCYHRMAFARSSTKDLYATEILAPLCTDSHPNTTVTRRTSPLRSVIFYIGGVIYRFARLQALLSQHKRESAASAEEPIFLNRCPPATEGFQEMLPVKESRIGANAQIDVYIESHRYLYLKHD